MKGYVANTDYDWYTYLKQQINLEEVNFWQPSGRVAFRAIQPGAPFFFKLKSPYYKIAGFGHFAYHSILPAWLAWEAFKEANGAPNFPSMRDRIEALRESHEADASGKYEIGCIMITQPIFFDESAWVDMPRDWARSGIQKGKTYDLTVGEGNRIWQECVHRARTAGLVSGIIHGRTTASMGDQPRYGEPYPVRQRLGQGTFRIEVTDAYGRACAVTREHTLPVLEAAHIKPYAQQGDHVVPNGLLLRSDIHALFDRGYVTVTPEHRFEVSGRLRQDFDNGRSYYPLHGNVIHLPNRQADRPDRALLEWHNQQVFLG